MVFSQTVEVRYGASVLQNVSAVLKQKLFAHLFFECQFVRNRWRQLFQLFSNTSLCFGRPTTAFRVIQIAVQAHSRNPVLLILAAKILWMTWTERTMLQFQAVNQRVPMVIILRRCLLKIEALLQDTTATRKVAVLTEAAKLIQHRISGFQNPPLTLNLLD